MTDIDWKNAPVGATHYSNFNDHCEKWHRLESGNWSFFCESVWNLYENLEHKEELKDAIPRPAKHRDWSDPAMWFDAPDWATHVATIKNSEENFIAYLDQNGFLDPILRRVENPRKAIPRGYMLKTIAKRSDCEIYPDKEAKLEHLKIIQSEIDAINYIFNRLRIKGTESKPEAVEDVTTEVMTGCDGQKAPEFLRKAVQHMEDCASQRDSEDGERSMGRTVKAFNAIYGTELTEEMGWQFMVLLKMSRSSQGDYTMDDYEDEAAYASLAGEAGYSERS